jgi:hypothetical protein
VGGEEDRAALVADLPDDVLDPPRVDRVHPGRRLVEEQQLGPVQQRAGEDQPHLHALGELSDAGVGVGGQVDRLQQGHRVLGRSGVEGGEELQVLQRGELLVVVGQLE